METGDGSGPEESLTASDRMKMVTSFSPDGRHLAFQELGDIWVLPLQGERKPQPFLKTPFTEGDAKFSPDGRWIAYNSNETGSSEIYVQPFPGAPSGPGGKWQISTRGGVEPVGARNGRQLYYRSEEKMMAVAVEAAPSFAASKPKVVFEGRYLASPGNYAYYDVSPDGQRFLMIKTDETAAATQLHLVVDWFEDLRRRAGSGRR